METEQVHNSTKQRIWFIAEIVGLVFVLIVLVFLYSKNRFIRTDELEFPIVKAPAGSESEFANQREEITAHHSFEDIRLSAKSAAVWDVKNQKFIYTKNERNVLPLASLTKLMTAMTAVELLPEESTISIAQEYLAEENGGGLFAYERWKASDLVAFTLLTSSNVGSRALATVAGAFLPKDNLISSTQGQGEPRELFIEELNRRAHSLGLESMTFYNDSGLDISENRSGAYGSAEDIVKLSDYILKNYPELLDSTRYTKKDFVSMTNFLHKAKNTNQHVTSVPGIISSKTGYTDLAQGNLVVTFSPGLDGPYIAVVMGSTFDGRFSDIEKLINATVNSSSAQ